VVDAASLLGLFATVFAAVAAAVPFGVSTRNWWMRSFGSRRQLSKRLSKVAVGVTLDYVKSLFGTPLMQKDAYNVAGAVDYIFMTDHAWIVARIRSGEVLAWSVTVTDKRFKVDLGNLTFGLVKGKRGRSRFSDVVEQPSGVVEEVGSVSYAYAERTYFGRPSAYQSFVFMHSMQGVGTFENGASTSVVGTSPFFATDSQQSALESIRATRQSTTVNTFLSCGRDDSFLEGGAAMWPVIFHEFVIPFRSSPAQWQLWLRNRLAGIGKR
jgi:hypothetical protein